MKTDNSFFSPNRPVFMSGPEQPAPQESVPMETPLEKANREATDVIRTTENKAKDLLQSDNPQKRAWGHQLQKAIDAQDPLRKRILERQNQNRVLAEQVKSQFNTALAGIAKREEALPATEKTAKKEDETKPAEEHTKRPEELNLMIAKDLLKTVYTKAITNLNQLVEKENANMVKQSGRKDVVSDRLYTPYEDRMTASLRSPNLVRLYDEIDRLYANPGNTVQEIRTTTRKIESLANESKFTETINTDKILTYFRFVANIEGKEGKNEGETRIAQKIDGNREPLASAPIGSSWEITNGEGVSFKITKNVKEKYSVAITGINEKSARTYAALAKDFNYVLPEDRRPQAAPTAVAARERTPAQERGRVATEAEAVINKDEKGPTTKEYPDNFDYAEKIMIANLISRTKIENFPLQTELFGKKYEITRKMRGPTPHYKIEETT
ncbi:MAG: hypothetical protein ABIG80_04460 [Patescibacteria group bacterium]